MEFFIFYRFLIKFVCLGLLFGWRVEVFFILVFIFQGGLFKFVVFLNLFFQVYYYNIKVGVIYSNVVFEDMIMMFSLFIQRSKIGGLGVFILLGRIGNLFKNVVKVIVIVVIVLYIIYFCIYIWIQNFRQ